MAALLVVHSSSSEADEASPSALASACSEAEEVEPQVQNWRFSELHSTNLAAYEKWMYASLFGSRLWQMPIGTS